MNGRLYESLKRYSDSDFYPFHMPGHKRSGESGPLSEFYRQDITEIDGFDNLHQPETIIRDAQCRAAQVYHSEETYFLINGSTSGILSAVSAIAGRGNKLIIARNCHKAVYHAAFLNHMELRYVFPAVCEEYDIAGEITASQIEKEIGSIIEQEGISAADVKNRIAGVVVTSPTYEGIVSDVRAIAALVHQYDLPLIVDQAHGAHFGFHPSYPENAVSQGADIVIHSVHKTLPAPTQTALLHRNGRLTDQGKLKKYLRIYQSSSPSYLLMAGIDEAIALAEQEGSRRLEQLLHDRNELLQALEGCRCIRVCPDTEPGKLVISVKNSSMTGKQLYQVLREKYHLQMEMASGTFVLAILSMMDTEEGFRRLTHALLEIDAGIRQETEGNLSIPWPKQPDVKMKLRDAFLAAYKNLDIRRAEGEVAADFVNLYPPGIPILVPGEVITEQIVHMITEYMEHGYTVSGIENEKVKVVAQGQSGEKENTD